MHGLGWGDDTSAAACMLLAQSLNYFREFWLCVSIYTYTLQGHEACGDGLASCNNRHAGAWTKKNLLTVIHNTKRVQKPTPPSGLRSVQ